MKSQHDRQIQEHEDTIKQLQQALIQASAANVKLHVKHIEAVYGGNEDAAQVALLAVFLDRKGCFGADVEWMVSALQVDTGKKMKDEEVYSSMLCRQGITFLINFALFQVVALLQRYTTVFMLLDSPADHWVYRLAIGLQGNSSNVAAASAHASSPIRGCRPISEAVCGGNEEAAQVALLAVILDRMGCFGATVERMVSALQVDTGKTINDEAVYPSTLM